MEDARLVRWFSGFWVLWTGLYAWVVGINKAINNVLLHNNRLIRL